MRKKIKTELDITNGSGNIKTLTLDCDVKKYYGKGKYKDLMDDPELCGDANNYPTEMVYYGIFVWDPYGTQSTNTVDIDVMLSYDTIYFEPRKLTQS